MSRQKEHSKTPIFDKILEAKRVEKIKEKYFPSLSERLESQGTHRNKGGDHDQVVCTPFQR
jgi:hypothetical protein